MLFRICGASRLIPIARSSVLVRLANPSPPRGSSVMACRSVAARSKHGSTAEERKKNEDKGLYPGLAYEVLNKRRGRPLAPFLLAYKMHFTMALSLMHRLTGALSSSLFYLAAIGLASSPYSFPEVVDFFRDMHLPPSLILATKFVIAWPVFFHMVNGIRHLAWDLGKGFEMPTVRFTGSVVLVLCTLATLYVCTL